MNYKRLLKSKKFKIAVWGTGYIGLSTMVYFAKKKIKCIGYDIPRYGKAEPFPSHIPCTKNIMVLLCDEQSCSDADCFAQAFKTSNKEENITKNLIDLIFIKMPLEILLFDF